MLKHNSYFEGQVQSIGFERNGRQHTVGVIDTGEFHFNTNGAERMTVVSGELLVRRSGGTDWCAYPAGTAFEVAGQSGFDIRAERPAAYWCEFI
jgi:uncharacterized protein YaiE (UPF0345 family)